MKTKEQIEKKLDQLKAYKLVQTDTIIAAIKTLEWVLEDKK